jgi:sarcosine oxidase, subunit beta
MRAGWEAEEHVTERADVIVIGAGVQGASVAFHLAERGASVIVVDRAGVAAGATGRSSGFVRMHYDLAAESHLAWLSYPYFRDWANRVGAGDCGFVHTGFVQVVPPEQVAALRGNVANMQALGIPTELITADQVADMVPGIVVDDVTVAAWEPESGYADPSGTAAGFLAGARRHGARFLNRHRVLSVRTEGDQVTGVATDKGDLDAPLVVNAAGAWAAQVAATVGLEVPIVPWRHETLYLGRPEQSPAALPVFIDHTNRVYFRPEGHDMLLVGAETGSEIGGSPDRPEEPADPRKVDAMIDRVCRRVPWLVEGTYRTVHGGQDGITPDQRPILGAAGPRGFHLSCGFSGTGFKTAPAIGSALARSILDGDPAAELAPFSLERFAEDRLIVGDHPYGRFWSSEL